LLRQIYNLPFSDKILFVKALLLIVFVIVFLKFGRYRTLVNRMNMVEIKKVSAIQTDEVERAHKLIKLIYSLKLFKNRCLAVSLSFGFLLKRKGVETQLKFGYKNSSGNLQAHAWLEHNGLPLTLNSLVAEEYSSFTAPLISNS
jgi:hypothetical protein